MRFIFQVIVFCFLYVSESHSQDTMYRSNGSIIPVLIISVESNNVSYKKTSDTASLIYFIDKAYVSKIVYHDGRTVEFPVSPDMHAGQMKNTPAYILDSLPNCLSINIFDIFFGLATIEYERKFRTGNYSIKVPLTVSFRPGNTINSSTYPGNKYIDRQFRTGLGVFYYPAKYRSVRYFAGLSFDLGKCKDIESYYETYEHIWTYSLLLQGGLARKLSTRVIFSLYAGAGFGIQHNTSSSGNFQYISNTLIYDYKAGITIGYKF